MNRLTAKVKLKYRDCCPNTPLPPLLTLTLPPPLLPPSTLPPPLSSTVITNLPLPPPLPLLPVPGQGESLL